MLWELKTYLRINFWYNDFDGKKVPYWRCYKVPGHTEGVVEQIGFRSTLIRKFDSTPITIPNYIFAEAPILNYTNETLEE